MSRRAGKAYKELWWFLSGIVLAMAAGMLASAMWATNRSIGRADAIVSLVLTLIFLALMTVHPVKETR